MRIAAGVLVALSLCCASGSAASFSTTLAYSSELHAAEIYAMSANGTGVVRLTHDAAPDRWPALSPDGTTLAFARKSGGMWSIFTMRVDGSGLTNVTQAAGLPYGFDGYPDWSADGRTLAFSANATPGGSLDIMLYDVASHAVRDLTPDSTDDLRPRFSPDGTRIAYAAGGDQALDVYVIDTDGTGRTRLTSAPGWQFEPTWSPDGTRIAFTEFPDQTSDIAVMNADGSNQRNITHTPAANDTQPTWTANGIAFRSDRSGVDGIYVMNPDGTSVRRLSAASTYDEDPYWSRDGRRIVFTSGRNATSRITVSNFAGGATRTLTNGAWFDTGPAWSPNAERIAFARSPSRTRSDIFVMRSDGRQAKNLTHGVGVNWGPAWSPDGTTIACVRTEAASDSSRRRGRGTTIRPGLPTGTRSRTPPCAADGRTSMCWIFERAGSVA
jgi:Tol biopolymer transport system component